MPKPDFALRSRPLKEVDAAMKLLRLVVLFHPDEICKAVPAKYCVCGKGERKAGAKSLKMIQCDECLEWFHSDCAGLSDAEVDTAGDWKCEWCINGADKEGNQRWISGRKRPKLRHVNDRPVQHGAIVGHDRPQAYSAPRDWEGKVAEVKELSRRKAVKKRKLEVAVQGLVDEGGHHVVDAEGLNGLVRRTVDENLVDEMVGAGMVNPDDFGDDE